MKIQIKAFNELSVDELYEVLHLRNLVFVVEQNCAYLDIDHKDDQAHHVMIYDDENILIAYARIFKPGIKYDTSRSEEHTSELQSRPHLVCRLLLEKKNKNERAG